MINKITLNKVASYKSETTLETDKKLNLIYGLNGTGKSTLSNYLHNIYDEKYKDCQIYGLDDSHEILVYNQAFIKENFFEKDNLKGIFTLSKENKEAETKIANAYKEIIRLESEKEIKNKEIELEKSEISKRIEAAKNNIWKIKTDYSGGDRVLEFCLEGLKGSKDILFDFVCNSSKPITKPTKNIDNLKSDLHSITGKNAQIYSTLYNISFSATYIEKQPLFNKQIVGNENSTISQLIKELGNSDWVKVGLNYLPTIKVHQNEICPFCQEETISFDLVEKIKSYFDESYENDINTLKTYLEFYTQSIQNIPIKSIFEENPKFENYRKDFEIKYNAFIQIIENNKKLIENKVKTPSVSLTLKSSQNELDELNEVIQKINELIIEHNNNIGQIEIVKSNIKNTFWDLMLWEYDQTISTIKNEKITSKNNINSFEAYLKEFAIKITALNTLISEEQKKTVNIDKAIENIKYGLVDLGITDFGIKKDKDNFYKIVRDEYQNDVFRSLSEGEKMIISFLYFIELCKGKKEATEINKKKIIVIDDPISSLSHIFVFNIGRIIHNEFFKGDKYEQVFLLTHSLYFFYEMTDTNKEKRKENQKLFRLSKNTIGSEILELSYEEIQNDYHSY